MLRINCLFNGSTHFNLWESDPRIRDLKTKYSGIGWGVNRVNLAFLEKKYCIFLHSSIGCRPHSCDGLEICGTSFQGAKERVLLLDCFVLKGNLRAFFGVGIG